MANSYDLATKFVFHFDLLGENLLLNYLQDPTFDFIQNLKIINFLLPRVFYDSFGL